MKIRKWMYILLAVLLMCTIGFSAFAGNTSVYADAIAATAGSDVLCPVWIRGNPGLMGFKLTFSYDSDVLAADSVQKGEVTQSGILDDNAASATPGAFEVIWSGSEDVTADGILMTLVFHAAEAVPSNTEIQVEVSQPDTFNEQWEDVPLQCEPISISFSDDVKQVTGAASGAVTQDAVLYAVDSALKEQGIHSVAELTEKKEEDFLSAVNKNIQASTGNVNYFSNVQAMTDAYFQASKESYLADVQQQVDGDKILFSVEQALETVGAESVDQVPENKQVDFVKTAEEKLAQYMPDAPKLSDRMDTATALETVQELQKRVSQDVDNSIPAPVEDHVVNHTLVIGLSIVGTMIFVTSIVLFRITRKRKQKNRGQ